MRLAFALLLALGAAASTPARAALSTSHLSTDADLFALAPSFDFVAEGRIGDRGGAATFELDLGPDTGAPIATDQYAWVSGQAEPFTLAYDPGLGLVTFTLGGRTLPFATPVGANEIFVRGRSANATTTIRVDQLVLDGEAVGDACLAAGSGGLDILRIEGGSLTDGFTLAGVATLSWSGTPPSQSQLAFQVKVGVATATPARAETWPRLKNLYR